MSSITELQQELVGNYINTSSQVMFLFEIIATLPQEIDIIWRKKWSAMTLLYALTRYSTAVDQINLLIPDWNFMSCKTGTYIDDAITLIQYLCLAWFSALRVYALMEGKLLLAGLVFLLNAVPFGTNLFNSITSVIVEDSEACTVFSGASDDIILLLSLITRISVIIGDLLVLVVTWTRTAQAYREIRRLNVKAPLATMLLRDGTLYFVILLLINIVEVVEVNVPTLSMLDVITPFINTLPAILACRFILNLRQTNEPNGSSFGPTSGGTQSNTLRFASNMGQSLQIGTEGDCGWEEASDVTEVRLEAALSLAQADNTPGITTEARDVLNEDQGQGSAYRLREP